MCIQYFRPDTIHTERQTDRGLRGPELIRLPGMRLPGWAGRLPFFLIWIRLTSRIRWIPHYRSGLRQTQMLSLQSYQCSSVRQPVVAMKLSLLLTKAVPVYSLLGSPIMLGRSHYVASHGQESCWGECGSSEAGVVFSSIDPPQTRTVTINGDASKVADGPFFRNSKTRFRDVTDGLTNTIFLGEHSSRLSDKAWAGVVPGAFVHPRFASPENGPDAAATLTLVHAGPSGGELDITGFPIIHPVNFPTFHVGQMYSEHTGGGHVGLGDGSVRFISENVDLILWAELSSMNEGEVIGEF